MLQVVPGDTTVVSHYATVRILSAIAALLSDVVGQSHFNCCISYIAQLVTCTTSPNIGYCRFILLVNKCRM